MILARLNQRSYFTIVVKSIFRLNLTNIAFWFSYQIPPRLHSLTTQKHTQMHIYADQNSRNAEEKEKKEQSWIWETPIEMKKEGKGERVRMLSKANSLFGYEKVSTYQTKKKKELLSETIIPENWTHFQAPKRRTEWIIFW